MLAADYVADVLVAAGVRHVFGVSGANIEDLFAAVQRRRPRLQAILAKHEHGAGTAADGYARLTGGLGVVMTTSGGGAMNVVHALAEAQASRVPVLALIGEPPTELQGSGAFQDTSGRGGPVDAAAVLGAVSVYCRRVTSVETLPRALDGALAAACAATPGPAVLLLAKDLQVAKVAEPAPRSGGETVPASAGDRDALVRALSMVTRGPVLVIAGDEVVRQRARGELARLVDRLDARVCVAPDARDAFDNGDSRFVGVAGAMGHPAVAQAAAAATTLLAVGTRLPLLARMGLENLIRTRPLVAIAREAPFVSSPDSVHLGGDVRGNLRDLVASLGGPPPGSRTHPDVPPHRDEQEPGARFADLLGASGVARAVSGSLAPGAVVLLDAGNTGAEGVHHVAVPPGGRWLLAMGMAGMGWSFGAAVGAACATGRRCTVLAGDGAFFMHGLEVHTAVEHQLPITYVLFNNRAHGMCVIRERLLLGSESGSNVFGPAHIGAGLAAMFPSLPAWDCTTLADLEAALARARSIPGPSVICAELPTVEVPPFLAFGGQR